MFNDENVPNLITVKGSVFINTLSNEGMKRIRDKILSPTEGIYEVTYNKCYRIKACDYFHEPEEIRKGYVYQIDFTVKSFGIRRTLSIKNMCSFLCNKNIIITQDSNNIKTYLQAYEEVANFGLPVYWSFINNCGQAKKEVFNNYNDLLKFCNYNNTNGYGITLNFNILNIEQV